MSNVEGRYPAASRYTVAEAPGLRVRRLDLEPGQEVPWHHHTEIDENFFCMSGPMQVSTRAPDAVHRLDPGDTCRVPAGVPHRVSGADDGGCRFMSVQVGIYDFIPHDD